MSESHAELDESDGCVKCHKLGSGVLDSKCLDCHEDLKKAINNKKGLHVDLKDHCIKCHIEHKGRHYNITNWKYLGGRKNFDHLKTGFKLEEKHASIACSSCHIKRAKSGRTYYPGLPSTCISCHKDAHDFERADIKDLCHLCHKTGDTSSTQTVAKSSFDHHSETSFILEGNHEKLKCIDCHQKNKIAKYRKTGSCKSCHRSKHGKGFSKVCTECHHPSRSFEQTEFKHGSTRFPLQAEHRKLKCSQCHKSKKQNKPGRNCINCHRDKHRKRFAKFDCETCHPVPGSRKVAFDHKSKTGFGFYGKHTKNQCRSCHRGKGPKRFERLSNFKKHRCRSCHTHRRAHAGRYQGGKCSRCHLEGGTRTTPFNHNRDTRFVLTGKHLELLQRKQCVRCHPKKIYKTGKLTCIKCHQDHHQGNLGKDCSKCHQPSVAFKDFQFDHDRSTKFKLVGVHRKLECAKCHLHGKTKNVPTGCKDCHQDHDPHLGKLGAQCDKCHETGKQAPKFDHQTMTSFTRTGAHLEIDCCYCHRTLASGQSPPQPGWTKNEKAQPVDKKFPIMGTTCSECHFDPHNDRYGNQCKTCHNTKDFKEVEKNLHTTGSFRLYGAHAHLECKRCHEKDFAIAGLGMECQLCHREDDVHNNGLGSDCGRCHTQHEWSNPRFNHTSVGFALRGAHRFALCRDCHGIGTFQGIPNDCIFCHQDEAARVNQPSHKSAPFHDCGKCHNQMSFSPARYSHPTFPLRGTHRSLRCIQCHKNEIFEGKPSLCEDCHLADFAKPGNDPNHISAGFSTHCQDCHTSISWQPARYWHDSFRRRGAHLSLSCQECHPGNNFNGAFGGLGWECGQCHGPGGPVNRFPHAHLVRGFPIQCDLCHSQNAWMPARMSPF